MLGGSHWFRGGRVGSFVFRGRLLVVFGRVAMLHSRMASWLEPQSSADVELQSLTVSKIGDRT